MIDTQSIRTKILDLAMRGQLTEQLPEDGTAEELYQQIQEEKQALIKAGKIKRKKDLTEFNANEVPFEIPRTWKWVRLAEICSIINGDRGKNYPAKALLKHEGIPFISALNLDGKGVIQDDNLLCLDEQQYNLLGSGKLQKDDIVICIRGSLGKHGRYPFDKGAIASSLVISRIMYAPQIMGDYIMIWLDSNAFSEEIKKYDSGTAQPNLAANSLEKFFIPLPPLAEQQRIVNRVQQAFSEIDTIDKLQKQYADNLNVLKSKLIDAAIQGQLTEQLPEDGTAEELYRQIQEEKQALVKAGKIKKEKPLPELKINEIPYEIPKSWKWVRIGEVVSFNPRHMALDDDLSVSFIPMPRVLEGYNNLHSSEERKWKDVKTGYTNFCEGDVGVAKITPCFQNRKSVVFRNLLNGVGAGTTEFTVMRPIGAFVEPEYLLWFCKSDDFIRKGVESFNGSVGQARVDKDYMRLCLLPLPPLAEQKRIVARLEELLPLCEKLK